MSHLTKQQKKLIEQCALIAAIQGKDPLEACPWPSDTPESLHWLAVWAVNRKPA